MRAKIDTALRQQLLADRESGMTLQQLATKYNVCESTAGYWCRKLNGQAPAAGSSSTSRTELEQQSNHQTSPPASVMKHNTSELEALLTEHWNRLPLLERVRILLNRA